MSKYHVEGDIAQRVANRMGKKAQSTWEDVGDELSSFEGGETSGYHSSQGGTILRRKFDVPESISELAQAGENHITIEARYGYVDAWLNDMEQIEPQIKLSKELTGDSDLSERDQKIAELQANIDKWLSELADQGKITF